MAEDTTLLLLEFDVDQGPMLSTQCGSIELTPAQLKSIKCCAFPESAKAIVAATHYFTFCVDQYRCYCLYVSQKSPLAPRGFHLFSFVIVSSLQYCNHYRKILEDASTEISRGSAESIFGDLSVVLDETRGDVHRLPLFAGISNNGSLLGMDLWKCLGISELQRHGRTSDVTRLWEFMILGQRVMVLGSTPKLASDACLAISSMIYPEQIPDMIPYIAVSDPRFMEIRETCQIVGTANPIVTGLVGSAKLFKIGFDEEVGFGRDQKAGPMRRREALNNELIRAALVENTARLKNSVNSALDEMLEENFVALLLGKVDVGVVAQKIIENGVTTTMDVQRFASILVHSQFFERLRKAKLNSAGMVKHLVEVDATKLCSMATSSELRRICKGFIRAIDVLGDDRQVRREIKRQLRIIRPNLVFPEKA